MAPGSALPPRSHNAPPSTHRAPAVPQLGLCPGAPLPPDPGTWGPSSRQHWGSSGPAATLCRAGTRRAGEGLGTSRTFTLLSLRPTSRFIREMEREWGETGRAWQGEPFGAKFNQCCPNSLQGCKILLVRRGLGNEDVASASGASRPPPSPWQPMPGDAEGQSPGLGAQGGRRGGWGHGQGGEGRGAVRTPGSRLQHSARSRWV